MLRRCKNLNGYSLGAIDGVIGNVSDVYFEDDTCTVRYIVADTGSWLPGRLVLLSPFSFRSINDHQQTLNLNLTKEKIQNSPSTSSDLPVSRQFEIDYHSYYGWPEYWAGPAVWGAYPYPVGQATAASVSNENQSQRRFEARKQGNPHLRSANEVRNYYIQARDGEIGHLEDFIFEDRGWTIRYLLVDTRNWWPGKKVLITPQSVEEVRWENMKIIADLERQQIQDAPEYDPSQRITPEYEARLHEHYHAAHHPHTHETVNPQR